jgi:hypothetical protein
MIKKIIHTWAAENYLSFDFIDPTLLSDTCKLGQRSRLASMAQPLWCISNPVHLFPDVSRDLAAAVSSSILAGQVGDSASGSGTVSDSLKRRLSETVVTRRLLCLASMGRSAASRTAGWLPEKTESELSSYWSGGRGPPYRGRHVRPGEMSGLGLLEALVATASETPYVF